ncbi:cyclic nucleotide-gated channel cone photoreceptor subunit alpha [Caerostris extrusa]|uniref:Cyclic nucleotide-gated channel cone photoreceptor subunit alpha n=1 Tax=Caerostris extrusa TaxID=172846 RepID=A0AAV4MZZ8_CAEEX|nr:cyclic nucleotide-gated channel cone photoreceptor subunit alpha [Caerostris extrusa]
MSVRLTYPLSVEALQKDHITGCGHAISTGATVPTWLELRRVNAKWHEEDISFPRECPDSEIFKMLKSAQADDDLDDVTVINSAVPENVKYRTAGCMTANGPRVVPGIITSSGGEMSCMVSNERRSVTNASTVLYAAGGPSLLLHHPTNRGPTLDSH